MLIGFTYDLKDDYLQKGYSIEEVAELDSEETIQAIETALQRCNFEVERIGNLENVIRLLNQGKRWPLVFNICEGVHGITRESQVPSLLEAYNIPTVFSDSLTLAVTLNKDLAKMIVANHNIATPPYYKIEQLNQIETLHLNYPLFVKPVTGGTGLGIDEQAFVRNRGELVTQVSLLLTKLKQPLLVETYLSGREFTVGVVGNAKQAHAIGVMEIVIDQEQRKGIYSYESKQEYKKWVTYQKVEKQIEKECQQIAVDAYRALGCRDAGRVDLKMDERGKIHFLEVNPLAGLNPNDSDLPILANLHEINYQQLLEQIMKSACNRLEIEHEW